MTEELKPTDLEKTYPTQPAEDGFFYDNEKEELLYIETKVYENGNRVKRVTLRDGKQAIVRQLKGRDTVETRRIENEKSGIDIDTATMSVAITFDGQRMPPEFYLDELMQMDYIRLNAACSVLNFT